MLNLNANVSEMSVPTLQSIVRENGIKCQDKRRREFLDSAVSAWQEAQKEVIAMAIDAEQVASESSEAIEVAVLSIGSLVIAALTSKQAIGFYRGVLKFAVFAVVITAMFAMAAVKWCWANRGRTAVYHWVVDTSRSAFGETVGAIGMVAAEFVRYFGGVARSMADGVAAEVRAIGSDGLMRFGLGGVAIEVQ